MTPLSIFLPEIKTSLLDIVLIEPDVEVEGPVRIYNDLDTVVDIIKFVELILLVLIVCELRSIFNFCVLHTLNIAVEELIIFAVNELNIAVVDVNVPVLREPNIAVVAVIINELTTLIVFVFDVNICVFKEPKIPEVVVRIFVLHVLNVANVDVDIVLILVVEFMILDIHVLNNPYVEDNDDDVIDGSL